MHYPTVTRVKSSYPLGNASSNDTVQEGKVRVRLSLSLRVSLRVSVSVSVRG